MTNPNIALDAGPDSLQEQGKIKEIARKIGAAIGVATIEPAAEIKTLAKEPYLDDERTKQALQNPHTD